MNDIASKPYEETVLLNKLLQALNFKIQLPAAGNTEKKLQDNIANLSGKNSDGPEINYINLDYINKIAPDNEAFRNELFMIFLNQSTQFLEKARQHQIDKKYFELSTLAHQFKPQGAYLGVDTLSKIIGDIEYEAYHEKKDKKLISLLNQASIIIEGVNKEIKKRMVILS